MRLFTSISIILFMLITQAKALEVRELYTGKAPVANFSVKARQQAASKAMEQVLIKLSGNPKIATIPKIKTYLNDAEPLIESYNYTSQEQNSILHATFSKSKMLKILQDTGQAFWGSNRPTVMVWLAVTDKNGNTNILNNDNSEIAKTLLTDAEQRGLPLTLPMLDLQDLSVISSAVINEMQQDIIKAATKRYHAQIIIIGAIEQRNEQHWLANWQLLLGDAAINWQSTASSASQLLESMVDNVATELAITFAHIESSALNKTVVLKINNINNLSEYNKLIGYLQNINSIAKIELVNLSSNSVTISIQSPLDLTSLNTSLSNSLYLTPAMENQAADIALTYSWVTSS